MKHPLLN